MNSTVSGKSKDPSWQMHKPWQNPITSIESAGGFSHLARALNPERTSSHSDVILVLDPHPGQIGGRVSGSVKLPRNSKLNADCALRLSCRTNVPSGQDDYFDDSSEVHWSQALRIVPRSTHDSVEVAFAFEKIPDDLPESQLPLGGSYVDWQLAFTASSENGELRHTFSIPVVDSDVYESRSASETESLLSTWRSENTWQPYRADIVTEEDSLVIRLGPWRGGLFQTGGKRGLAAILLSFSLSVVLLFYGNDELVPMLVTGLFGIVGLFVTVLAGYLWVRTVEIRVWPGRLSLHCRIFGRTVQTRVLSTEEISGITVRFAQLYVTSDEYGELELIDSVNDPGLLNALRRLIVAFLAPT